MPVSADSIYSGGGNSQNGEHLEQIPEPLVSLDPQQRRLLVPYKKTGGSGATTVRYKECLKNHAAAMGGNAMDGCGEFMPSGEEGTLEALKCSACFCHRNFHRKEVEGEQQYCSSYKGMINVGGPDSCYYSVGCPTAVGGLNVSPKAAVLPQQMIMAYNKGAAGSAASDDLSDEHGVQQLGRSGSGGDHEHNQRSMVMKKRFRTKFTPEQKEKMLGFAERAGWKIQKQEEAVVQQFCQELGIKRRVLKVWMHNNKHNYAFKKNSPIITSDHN